MVELAIATGIPPSTWADEGARSIATAVVVLEEQKKESQRKNGGKSGQQLNG